ncbi:hypothetical protein FHR81_002199 [Actinoalloteichus hoggarensis]|uniref:Uncharacterized protein n=1 Tax=Actinoalloteichus hoggarensis TaxID=1470176 RepID=A0A221W5P8_9PSEU|nr:DUF5134 domain-containing protein [Actinoalloteichus hoggarensis]ASO21230.1 hypothetical protein AHOG_18025 [Actinoalloteichus hoggarensis]MBB5921161.1 hypothetical protein [Actinoalloteichus hoggarensis]
MVDEPLLRWLFTIGFAVALIGFLRQLAGRRVDGPSLPARISALTHVLMCVAMIAMAWPWGMSVPLTPQLVVFSLATAWFLALTVGRLRAGRELAGGLSAHVHHTLMAAAMVWMLAIMPAAMTAPSSGRGGHNHALAALGPAGEQVTTLGAVSTPPERLGLSSVVAVLTGVIGLYLILSSLRWIAGAVDAAQGVLDVESGTRPAAGWTRAEWAGRVTAEVDGASTNARPGATGLGTVARRGTATADPGSGSTPGSARVLRVESFEAACHAVMSVGMGAMLLVML